MRADQIVCTRCKRPVDSIEWFDDWDHPGRRVIRVWCHGERDEMVLDFNTLSSDEIEEMKTSQGFAFVTPSKLEKLDG